MSLDIFKTEKLMSLSPTLPILSRSLGKGSLMMLLLLTLCMYMGASSLFKVSPLVDDYFEKVYLVNEHTKQYYLTISCKETNLLSISISDQRSFQEAPRFNIYGNMENKPKMGRATYTFLKECQTYVNVNSLNFLQVRRTKETEPIFILNNVNFSNYHNSFKVEDNSTKWGLGERFQSKFRVTDGRWTLWNRDKPWIIDRGLKGLSDQTYGHQPVYLAREKQSHLFHLVYFKNTFGLLIQVSKDGDQLAYNSVGGNIHFLIVLGQSDPEEVLERYHDYIGPSLIPPFWSLGYHQCRWGYETANALVDVLRKFKEHDLPIDTIWSDLDYMDGKMIFTVNPSSHGGGKLNAMMKQHQIHFIPLMDVGVSTRDNAAISLGRELDVFLRNPKQLEQYYTGEVWPGDVLFVDFHHPNAFTFWKNQLNRLYEQVKFSGIWLDMNEPSNFRGNEPASEPFRIQQNEGINQMTINVDIPHYTTSKDPLYHREAHTYYGHMSTVPTYEFLKEVGKRPFIISRSNSVGSGHFAGHWTGDNVATWQFLRASINGNFLFQIFGIQMVGSDICGFYQDTTEQLCSRWMQLGAFYPFARNHNHNEARSQEPYSFGEALLTTSRQSLKTRYSLLKHMYTVMVMKKGKGSFFRPLIFEFPNDEGCYVQQFLETQFLIGKSLMVAPIVYQGATNREVYFPQESSEYWYRFNIDPKHFKLMESSLFMYVGGKKVVIESPLPGPPVTFLRGGYGLLMSQPATRSAKLNNRFSLLAGLKQGQAVTHILGIDNYDNESQIATCIDQGCLYTITLKKNVGESFTLSWSYEGNPNIRAQIQIYSILAMESIYKWQKNNTSIHLKDPQGMVSLLINEVQEMMHI